MLCFPRKRSEMGYFSYYNTLRDGSRKAILGGRVFQGEKRELFKNEVLNSTIIRTHLSLYLVLIIQIINYTYNLTAEQHAQCLFAIRNGTISYSVVCAVYAAVFICIRNRHPGRAFKYFAVRSFWALMLLCSLWFTYANFVEERTAAYNITLMVLALSVIPVFSLSEVLAFLLPYMAVNIAMGLYLKVPHYFIQQILILMGINIFASQTQYVSYMNVFTERQHLHEKNDRLEKLSETDPVTGLLNRRGIASHLHEYEHYYRYSREYICVLMLGIDHFRDYNMLRETSDSCLVRVAESIRACARQSTDAVALVGDGDFLIISDTKNEGAISFALRIKRSVEALKIVPDEKRPQITVSIGVASPEKSDDFRRDESPVPELIRKADEQLSNARLCGKNCVSSGDVIFR